MRTNALFFGRPSSCPRFWGGRRRGGCLAPFVRPRPCVRLAARCSSVWWRSAWLGAAAFSGLLPPGPPPRVRGGGSFFGRPSGCSGWRLSFRSFGCRSSCRPVAARLRSRWVQILSSVHCNFLCQRHQSGARPPTASFRIGHNAAALETLAAAVTAPRPGILDVALSA